MTLLEAETTWHLHWAVQGSGNERSAQEVIAHKLLCPNHVFSSKTELVVGMAQKPEREHRQVEMEPLTGRLGSVLGASVGLNLVRKETVVVGMWNRERDRKAGHL